MTKDMSFHDHIIKEVMGTLTGITSKPFLDGWALYMYDTQFGLIVGNELFFKVDERNKKEYIHLKSHPFSHTNKQSTVVEMPYWSVPLKVQNDKKLLLNFMRISVAIGLDEEEKQASQAQREYLIDAKVWEHEDGSWRFITVPKQTSDEIHAQFSSRAKGLDSIPVQVTVGLSSWKTSLFFSKSHGGYILPIKREVRVKESIEDGKIISIKIAILV